MRSTEFKTLQSDNIENGSRTVLSSTTIDRFRTKASGSRTDLLRQRTNMVLNRRHAMVGTRIVISMLIIALALCLAHPAKCTTTLEGRIEAIVKPGATLPAPVLKLQVAQMDTSLQNSTLSAGITTPAYPEYLLGKWGGELKTTWVKTEWAPNPKAPKEYILGSVGKVVFEFVKEGQSVRLKPSSVNYPAHVISHEQFLKTGARSEAIDREHLPVRDRRTFNMLALTNKKTYHPDGSTTERVVALNDLKTLRRGIVEQDMVVREYDSGKFHAFKETVLRFTWHRSNLVYCQIGIVQYDAEGNLMGRSILAGWLTQNWRKIADEVSADYEMPWDEIINFGVHR